MSQSFRNARSLFYIVKLIDYGVIQMKIAVTLSTAHVNPNLHETVGQLLAHTLARFSTHISQASIVVSDENGPRGGVDKLCRVHLTMPGSGSVTTTARHGKVLAAVYAASRRARRVVVAKLQRPQSLRVRRRGNRGQLQDKPELALSGEL